jgi:hypothetical protein
MKVIAREVGILQERKERGGIGAWNNWEKPNMVIASM